MATRRFEVNRYSLTCDDCKHETFPVFIYETRWDVGYDWEDGETFYFCPVCEAKHQLNSLKHKAIRKAEAIAFGIKIFCIHLKRSGKLRESFRTGMIAFKTEFKIERM